jgi:cardiolipin synthase
VKSWFAELTALRITAAISLILVTGWVLLALFAPHQPYNVDPPQAALNSPEFAHMLETVADARLTSGNKTTVFTNGENFYEAELGVIRGARHSVNLEAYIFSPGDVTKRFVDALAERARAGVKVKLLVDAVGSFSTGDDYLRPITSAGGQIGFYHRLRWYTWDRVNNRTHREIIVVDGKKAFLGGAGFADHWLHTDKHGKKRWRDTMAMIEGPAVAAVQGTFVENWLEATGEVIVGTDYYPILPPTGNVAAMVVNSSAGAGRSTRARILFQTLIASAKARLYVNTPYFLPDISARAELAKAAQRGVDVRIITPGKHIDHSLTRSSSRRLYGEMLQAGVKIYEYRPGMLHVKSLLVDDTWSVLGSTNIDNRSFELNDEINLASYDGDMTARLNQDFLNDLRESDEVTYQQWQDRPWTERLTELFGRLIERQQ